MHFFFCLALYIIYDKVSCTYINTFKVSKNFHIHIFNSSSRDAIYWFCFNVKLKVDILKFTDDDCFLDDGSPGICMHVDKCSEAVEEIRSRQHPKLCSFIGKDPIVCCRLTSDGPLTAELREDISANTAPTEPSTSTIAAPSGFDKESKRVWLYLKRYAYYFTLISLDY